MNDDLKCRLKSIEERLDFLEQSSSHFQFNKRVKDFISDLTDTIKKEFVKYHKNGEESDTLTIRFNVPQDLLNPVHITNKYIIESDIRYIDHKIKNNLFLESDIIEFINKEDIAKKLQRIYYYFLANDKNVALKVETVDKTYKECQQLYHLELVCEA